MAKLSRFLQAVPRLKVFKNSWSTPGVCDEELPEETLWNGLANLLGAILFVVGWSCGCWNREPLAQEVHVEEDWNVASYSVLPSQLARSTCGEDDRLERSRSRKRGRY